MYVRSIILMYVFSAPNLVYLPLSILVSFEKKDNTERLVM